MSFRSFWLTMILLAIVTITIMGYDINITQAAHDLNNKLEIDTNIIEKPFVENTTYNGLEFQNLPILKSFLDNSEEKYEIEEYKPKALYDNNELVVAANNIIKSAQSEEISETITNSRVKRGCDPKEIVDEIFLAESLALSSFAISCIAINSECENLYWLENVNPQLVKKIADDFLYNYLEFIRHTAGVPNYSTMERRKNAKSIMLSLSGISFKMLKSIHALGLKNIQEQNVVVSHYANKILRLAIDINPDFLIKIPQCEDIYQGENFDFYDVQHKSCNPLCGYDIFADLSDKTHLSYEIPSKMINIMKKYNKKDTRCDCLRDFVNFTELFAKDVVQLTNIYDLPRFPTDHKLDKLFDYVYNRRLRLVRKIRSKPCCIAIKTCCATRTLLKNLSRISIAIDRQYEILGDEVPLGFPLGYVEAMRKISDDAKKQITYILTDITLCRNISENYESCKFK